MMGHTCGFFKAWVGPCREPVSNEEERCSKHANKVCCSCGNPATHECPETSGFVCGALLCDDCEHTICENGCNSGAPRPEGLGIHCKKTHQVYKPWYAQDYIDKHGEEAYEELVEKHNKKGEA